MAKFLTHIKLVLVSLLQAISAVCASTVSAGMMSEVDLEALMPLGFHQKAFTI